MMVLFLLLLFSYKIQENVFEIQRNFYDIKNKIHKFILFLFQYHIPRKRKKIYYFNLALFHITRRWIYFYRIFIKILLEIFQVL